MDIVFGLIVGISLAASCGFRVFVPMLVMGVAVRSGQLELTQQWAWIGSWPALITFGAATVTEIAAYFIPWLDNILDTLATPAAIVAGTIAMAACVAEMSPLLQWSVALIAGGGAAGLVQSSTVAARGTSTATTGGLGNFLVSVAELTMSFILSVLAVVVPIVAGLILCAVAFFAVRLLWRRRKQRNIPVQT